MHSVRRFAPQPFGTHRSEHDSLNRESRFGHSLSEVGLFPIQPKLVVGLPNDKYEQEAERVEEQILRMSKQCHMCQPGEEDLQAKPIGGRIMPLVQMLEGELKEVEVEEDDELIQSRQAEGQTSHWDSNLETRVCTMRSTGQPSVESTRELFNYVIMVKPKSGRHKGDKSELPVYQVAEEANSDIESRIKQSRNGGQPLPEATRLNMEHRFGADFGQVRVHTDNYAQGTAAALGARAFTSGSHIWFGKGASPCDERLLAHELTHVIQQNKLLSQGTMRSQQRLIQRCEACIDRELYTMPDPEQASTPDERRRRLSALENRRRRLRNAFRHDMTLPRMEGLRDRLNARAEGDSLAARFHSMLHTASRLEMLDILSERITESRSQSQNTLQSIESAATEAALQEMASRRYQRAARNWYRNTRVLSNAVDSINSNPGEHLQLLANFWLEREAGTAEFGVAYLLRDSPWPEAEEAINNPPTPLPDGVRMIDVLRAMSEDISEIVLRHGLLDMAEFQELIRERPSQRPPQRPPPQRRRRLRPIYSPEIPVAATFVQRNPEGEHIQITNFIGEYEYRPEFAFFRELPRTIAFYPGADQSCQDDYIYYDPNQSEGAGRTVTLNPVHGIRRDGHEYAIYYDRYDIFIVLGPSALSNLPYSLLRTLSHELVHLRQDKAKRRFLLSRADRNRAALDAGNLGEMRSTLDVRSDLTQESLREAGIDVNSRSDVELQAHATTFAHFFDIHIESARDNLVPLCYHHKEFAPWWSYDWASPAAQQYAVRVAVDTIMTGENRRRFDRSVLPELDRVTAQASRPPSSGTSPGTGPDEVPAAGVIPANSATRFLEDLIAAIRDRSS